MTNQKPSLQKQLNMYSKLQLNQIKHLHDQLQARKDLAASLAFRKEILEKKKVKNFQSEYDRIRSHLEQNSTMPFVEKAKVKSRADELRKLGAKAFDTIN